MKLLLAAVVFSIIMEASVAADEVSIAPSPTATVTEFEYLTLSCNTAQTVNIVTWRRNQADVTGFIPQVDGTCSPFGIAVDTTVYNYRCDAGNFTWTILNVTRDRDGEVWSCKISSPAGLFETPGTIIDVKGCSITPVANGGVNTTQLNVYRDSVIIVTCNADYRTQGHSVLTCQSDGTWDFPWPICERATTTSDITTTTSVTHRTTRITNTMADISLTPKTNPVSLPSTTRTTTDGTASTFSYTTAVTTILAATSASTSMTITPIAKTKVTSDQALITMVIVVSVIGCILVLAVFVLIFLLLHWKKCFIKTEYHNHRVHSSDSSREGRKHKQHDSGKEYSTTQKENVLKNYYFYRGKINPAYDGTLVTSNCHINETFQDVTYNDQLAPRSYQYNYNWL